MKILWIIVVGIPILAAILMILYAIWQSLRNQSNVLVDIRHGKGIFLTFTYTPEEWEYFTQTLPFTGKNGKVCFARNHIYLSDGREEILYEISGSLPISPRLRKVSIESAFVVFTVRTKELVVKEDEEVKPDSPDNLWQYQILIPDAQLNKTDELIGFYRKRIDKINEQYY